MSGRITFKKIRPNPLFEEWLQDLYNEAVQKDSKLKNMLKEALNSISKYPLPLQTGAECAILHGFGKKLCLFIDQKLEVYNSLPENQLKKEDIVDCIEIEDDEIEYVEIESNKSTCESNKVINLVSNSKVLISPKKKEDDFYIVEDNDSQNALTSINSYKYINNNNSINGLSTVQKRSKQGQYNPSYRSGSYAILIALLNHYDRHHDLDNCFLTKDDLIEKAQPLSEESFTKYKPNSYYTAWSNMSTLVKKGLVIKVRKKKVQFKLSEEGILLAKKLLDQNCAVPSTNDLINKGIGNLCSRVSEENNDIGLDCEQNQEVLPENDNSCIKLSVGDFNVVLLIDKQETSGASKKNDPTVAQFKKYPDLKHEFRHLNVGDFTWVVQHKVNKNEELVLPYIVERKRMDDLASSIKDGRFHEQKFRLKKCGIPNIFYLIENYGSNKHLGLPMQTLMQAIANTRVQDGFKVHVTESLTHSAKFLAMMSKRLEGEYKNQSLIGRNQFPINTDLMTFTYFNKSSCKNKPLTVTATFIKLLLQLKGLSVEKALAITNTYNTPRSLIVAYSKCSEKEGEMLLAYLKYGELSKNVGPSLSKSIYQLFTTK